MTSPVLTQLDRRLSTGSLWRSGTSTMTMGDVINRSLVLFSLTAASGVASWSFAVQRPELAAGLAGGASLAAFAISLILAFMPSTPTALVFAFALLEGVSLGAVSQFFDQRYPGIVMQAVLATACLFGAVLLGYRAGLIRVTARSARILFYAMLGYVAFGAVNAILVAAGVLDGFGIGNNGPIGIGISLVAIALGSYSLAVDFDSIQRTVNAGVPTKTAWVLGYGLLVSLVWLYVEFLRLFARLSND